MLSTPIEFLGEEQRNKLFIKREDLIPYSFGGNKARKAFLFFNKIDSGNFDYVVTYGSSHSNHCRIVSNMAAARKIKCCIISPLEVSDITYNSYFMQLFGAKIITVPVDRVHDTIDVTLRQLMKDGQKPYFIPGGGHSIIGTKAYVQCYNEICDYEFTNKIHFDFIFFASGTGTTQAGLICGQLLHEDEREIVGISIARNKSRGREIIINSIHEFLFKQKAAQFISEEDIQRRTIFIDDYIGVGYSKKNETILSTIKDALIKYGLPLDSTYTGKAFYGMKQYLFTHQIQSKNILFIHTGGTPLFFNDLDLFEGYFREHFNS